MLARRAQKSVASKGKYIQVQEECDVYKGTEFHLFIPLESPHYSPHL